MDRALDPGVVLLLAVDRWLDRWPNADAARNGLAMAADAADPTDPLVQAARAALSNGGDDSLRAALRARLAVLVPPKPDNRAPVDGALQMTFAALAAEAMGDSL